MPESSVTTSDVLQALSHWQPRVPKEARLDSFLRCWRTGPTVLARYVRSITTTGIASGTTSELMQEVLRALDGACGELARANFSNELPGRIHVAWEETDSQRNVLSRLAHLLRVQCHASRWVLRQLVRKSAFANSSFQTDSNADPWDDLLQAFISWHMAWELPSQPIELTRGSTVSGGGQAAPVDRWMNEFHAELHRRGGFASWYTASNWLALRRLLAYLSEGFLQSHAATEPVSRQRSTAARKTLRSNRLHMLLVRGPDSEGQFLGTTLAATTALQREGECGYYVDPVTWGVLGFDDKLRQSLRIAAALAGNELRRNYDPRDPRALRVSLDEDSAQNLGSNLFLTGDSAGGLLVLSSVATALGKPLDANATASFTVGLVDEAGLEDKLANAPETLTSDDFAIGTVGGLPEKVSENEPLSQLPICRVFVCAGQKFAAARNKKGEPTSFFGWDDDRVRGLKGKTGIDILPVGCTDETGNSFGTLLEILDAMTADARIEAVLEAHADKVLGKWDAVRDAGKGSEQSVQDERKEHRFDRYVWPHYRRELPVREVVPKGSPDVLSEARSEPKSKRVPGEGRVQIAKLLGWLVRKDRSLVVYDRAGAGKTVFSWRIEHELVSEGARRVLFQGRAPLVVRCDGSWPKTDIGDRLLTLRELLESELRAAAGASPDGQEAALREVLNYALQARRVVVIVDGFDQFTAEERRHVVGMLTNKSDPTAKNQCRWIITSRVHTIEALPELFGQPPWTRIRIEPFDEQQQNDYFADTRGRWLQMVPDRKAVKELLGLPLVLKLMRDVLDTTRRGKALPVFRTLSDLFVISSRKLLERAIKTTAQEAIKSGKSAADYLDANGDVQPGLRDRLEQVLATIAFEMLLARHFNAELDDGPERKIAKLQRSALRRYSHDLNLAMKQSDLEASDVDDIQRDLKRRGDEWRDSLDILKRIELNHRSITEAYLPERIAFRSRKIMECYAARYLVKFATDADRDAIRPFLGDDEWEACWDLAVDMPAGEMVIDKALATFALLYERPTGFPRPTRLLYRTWFRLKHETDARLHAGLAPILSGYRAQFLDILSGTGMSPEIELAATGERTTPLDRARLAAEMIAERDLWEHVRPGRRGRYSFQELRPAYVDQMAKLLRRESGAEVTDADLAAWFRENRCDAAPDERPAHSAFALCSNGTSAHATAEQKSDKLRLTFLMGASPKDAQAFGREKWKDERYNGGPWRQVEIPAFRMSTCAVTRGQYRLFDAAREQMNLEPTGENPWEQGKRILSPDDDSPITHVDWFDGFAYALWLGDGYQLPTERMWEGAAWGGLDRWKEKQAVIGVEPYVAGFTRDAVNFGGERTLPVRWDEARRAEAVREGDRDDLPGVYKGNGFGIWQMSGTTYEWCVSRWNESLDGMLVGEAKEPLTLVDISMLCSVRGGSWNIIARNCRCSYRSRLEAGGRRFNLGLRVART